MMETNGEAGDFVIYRNEFVDNSSELTPYGRDHIMEIAARMPSAPFPVLVQRSLNNADPELDHIRRDIVVRVLTDLGNQDADQRTVVSQPLIQKHADATNSELAWRVLIRWDEILPKFVKVMPNDYKRVLEAYAHVKAQGLSGDEAVMAAFESNKRDAARVGGN